MPGISFTWLEAGKWQRELLSGLDDERITQVVDAFRRFGVDWVVPQHCTGLEAIVAFANRMPAEVVFASTGSTFVFGD